jgi:hypothetical protein
MWWTRGARLARGRAKVVSGLGGGPRIGLADAGAHRRAVAPRAARARDTVVAGCGIGPHAAGEGITSENAHSRFDARRDSSADRGVATNARNVREASSNNPVLHPRPTHCATTERHLRSVRTAANAVDLRVGDADDVSVGALDGPSLRREGSADRIARDAARRAATRPL